MFGVQQSIRHPLGVTVYGSALLRTEPDIAGAWIQIGRTAKQPEEAFDEVYEGIIPNREPVGYRASVTFRVRIHDVDLVEPALVGAVVHIEDLNPDTANSATRAHGGLGGDPSDPAEDSGLGSGGLTVAAAVMLVYSLLAAT